MNTFPYDTAQFETEWTGGDNYRSSFAQKLPTNLQSIILCMIFLKQQQSVYSKIIINNSKPPWDHQTSVWSLWSQQTVWTVLAESQDARVEACPVNTACSVGSAQSSLQYQALIVNLLMPCSIDRTGLKLLTNDLIWSRGHSPSDSTQTSQ